MKNIKIVVAIAILAIVFNSCKRSPTEGFVVSINATATTSPSSIRVFDVSTDTRLSVDGILSVKLTGKDANRIYTPGGYQSFIVSEGQILFSLRNGDNPTIENPLEFNVVIEPKGYLAVTYPIKLTSNVSTSFNIGMVNLNNLPKGSTLIVKPTEKGPSGDPIVTDTSGKTSAPITIVTDTTGDTKEKVKVVIPSGTKLQDDDGKAIKGDNISTSIVFFKPTEEGLKSFPGGTENSNIVDTLGNKKDDGSMSPAGWVNIDIKVDGNAVKNFDKPIDVDMDLDPTILNPETDQPYKEGEIINIYSKSEGDEDWTLEGTAIIIKSSTSGKLSVPMKVSHLSVWAAANFSVACGTVFSITLKNTGSTSRQFVVSISKTNAGAPPTRGTNVAFAVLTIPANSTLTTTNQLGNFKPASGKKYFVDYWEVGNPNLVETFGPDLLCGATPPAFTIFPSVGTMEFVIQVKCSNGNQIILPKGTRVYFIDNNIYNTYPLIGTGNANHKVDPADNRAGTWSYTDINVVSNYNTITLPTSAISAGKNYRFSVYYDTNSGGSRSREDKIFPTMVSPTQSQDVTGMSGPKLTAGDIAAMNGHITPIIVTLASCPF